MVGEAARRHPALPEFDPQDTTEVGRRSCQAPRPELLFQSSAATGTEFSDAGLNCGAAGTERFLLVMWKMIIRASRQRPPASGHRP